MRDTKVDIAVIGNIVKETILYPDGIVGPGLGSPCAYTSLALARLGERVGMVTYCGEEWAKQIEGELRRVDTTGFTGYMRTTENHLIYAQDGSNRVEYFKKAPVIYPDILPQGYREASFFFICPMDYEVSLHICEQLYAAGKQVMVDLGGFGGTTSYNHFSVRTRRGARLMDALCACATIIKASKDDLKYIMPGMSMEECTEYFVSRGPRFAVVTMGPAGAIYREAGGAMRVSPRYEIDNAVKMNSTGAGDAFAAGVITALRAHPEDIANAAFCGNCLASLIMEKEGGCAEQRMPTGGMLRQRMEGE
ncbi:MAG: carbohydrate kinase family protein [Oscillospiraceae bacterium]|nr:carbohydrate kinase family protein [Oscillospiraceae bacterium]